MKKKRLFTLLELCIGFALLVMMAVLSGVKLHHLVQKRRFRSQMEQLHSQLVSCHRLALNMQADWEAVLQRRKDEWILRTRCLDQPKKGGLPLLHLQPFDVLWNGEKIDSFRIEFSGTGEPSLYGTLQIIGGSDPSFQRSWSFPKILHKESSKENKETRGPTPPRLPLGGKCVVVTSARICSLAAYTLSITDQLKCCFYNNL